MSHSVCLTEVAKRCLQKLLAHHNKILDKWRKFFPDMDLLSLHKAMSEDWSDLAVSITPELRRSFERDCLVIRRILEPKVALGNLGLAEAVIFGFRNMCARHSSRWARRCNSLEFDDFMQECYVKIFRAMFMWMPEKGSSLLTFLWCAVSRHLGNVVNQQGTLLTRLKNDDLKVVRMYKRAAAENPGVSRDDIVKSLNLKDREALGLRRALVSVSLCGDTASSLAVEDCSEMVLQEGSVNEIIRLSNLTPIEEATIRGAMNSHFGWQSELARDVVSSVTGKPLSRMRISQILRAARSKVAKTLGIMGVAV